MKKITFNFLLIIFFCTQSVITKAQCCNYKLIMHDTYGDGWNGAFLEVLINNVLVGTYSATNYGSILPVNICNGDSLNFQYTSGMYENENSYELLDSAWNVVFEDGPNPDTGNVFSTIGNCNTIFFQGSHPCTAISIDTGQCIFANNTGSPGSGQAPNCSNYQGGDIWFTMKVPPSGNLIFETDSGTINDTGLAVWKDSTCINLQLIGCDDDAGNGYYSFLSIDNLTPGERIYIQVFGWGGANGSFKICVKNKNAVVLDSSELPIVIINTQGQTIIQNTKINCLMDIKYNGVGNVTKVSDTANIYSGNIGIEIRGASSANYPQPPYGFETRDSAGVNKNVSLLGMPAENDWALLSNYNDRTLIKNITAFKLFQEMGNYSVRAQLCEVLIDSSYKGIYVIAEKIKRDGNRVNIAKLSANDTIGDKLTGGYILQQNYWNNTNSFQSNFSPIDHPGFDVHFLYQYPNEVDIKNAQKIYIASFVDSLETALYSTTFADPLVGYRKYMDVKSFIDYFLVNEFARSADGFKKSVFFNKDKNSRGGKLKAGPVWDFDWAWKNIDINCSLYNNFIGAGWAHLNNDCPADNNSTGWYVRLLQDSMFKNELQCTYIDYRQNILDTTRIFNFIDSMALLVNKAQARHFEKWPILGVSGPAPDLGAVAVTYNAEIDSLKTWIKKRVQWLDINMPGLCSITKIAENSLNYDLVCYPNPTNESFVLDYSLPSKLDVSYRIYNSIGAVVFKKENVFKSSGNHKEKIETSGFIPGIYNLEFRTGLKVVTKKIVVIR